jgi:hypothetical protein
MRFYPRKRPLRTSPSRPSNTCGRSPMEQGQSKCMKPNREYFPGWTVRRESALARARIHSLAYVPGVRRGLLPAGRVPLDPTRHRAALAREPRAFLLLILFHPHSLSPSPYVYAMLRARAGKGPIAAPRYHRAARRHPPHLACCCKQTKRPGGLGDKRGISLQFIPHVFLLCFLYFISYMGDRGINTIRCNWRQIYTITRERERGMRTGARPPAYVRA